MAEEKKAVKPKKASTAKTEAKPKTPSKAKTGEKATAAKKTAAKATTRKSKTVSVSPEHRYRMIEVAAYYLAEKDGFAGNPVDYWIAAELQFNK
jgi:hypothetical protein